MHYFSTMKSLNDALTRATNGDVYLFYKPAETMPVGMVQQILESKIPVTFHPYEDRDDLLVLFGMIFGKMDLSERVTLCDNMFAIPKRFLCYVDSAAAKPTRRKKKSPEPSVAEAALMTPLFPDKENTAVSDEETAQSQEDAGKDVLSDAMPKPVSYGILPQAESDGEMFGDPDAEKLFQIIGIRSKDVGFTWNTEMLMLNILRIFASAEDDESLEGSIKALRNGNKIWSAVKDHVTEIRAI